MSFQDFKLSQNVQMGLTDMGFKKPTPIQEQAIPQVLAGKDILASAQTGTGKTAAFAIPLIEKLSEKPEKGIRALILAPTRELAIQIDEQFWSIGYHAGISSACIYGGSDWGVQEKAIREGVNVLVATPGRLLDHIKISSVDFSKLEFLVLDEADRMLDMGFIPDVRSIIHRLPKKRQTLLFSATLSERIESLSRELTNNPVRINVSSFKPAEGVTQLAYKVREDGKLNLVLSLFDNQNVESAIVFTSTKRGADGLSRALSKKGVKVSSMHGDRDQRERESTLADFKAGRIKVIVATDVMARGIDVDGVSHVVNYSVPHDLDDYIHRIGRTARAEEKGTAITLVSGEDTRYFKAITNEMKDRIQIVELPDHLTEFNTAGLADATREKGSTSDRRPKTHGKTQNNRNSSRRSDHSDNRRTDNRPAPAEKNSRNQESGRNDNRSKSGRQDNRRNEPRQNRPAKQKPDQNKPKKHEKPGEKSERERNQRIKNVSNPFEAMENAANGSQNGSAERKGFWSKITSIFSK